MQHFRFNPVAGMLFLAFVCCAASGVRAQAYPSKPVRLVVPFAPGGGSDLVGRLLAQKLGAEMGQQFVVDNRAGAGGRIGAELIAKAPPDGYALLFATSSVMVAAPALYSKLPFNMPRDYAPIALVAFTTYVIVAHSSVPARTVQELIALAKARPGQLRHALSGTGSHSHLASEYFSSLSGIKMVQVPYKGSAPATLVVMTGETDVMFNNVLPALPMIKTGRLRALGITSLKRSALLPEVATVAESGLPGFEAEQLYALLAPAGTPREIVRRLNEETVRVMSTPETKARLVADGSEVRTSTPQELEKMIVAEIAKWTKVAKQAGITEEGL